MSQVIVNTVKDEPLISYNISNSTSNSEQTTTVTIPSSPILILPDRIRIFGELITLNKYYPFEYKGKKYLLHRPEKKVTEIYSVK